MCIEMFLIHLKRLAGNAASLPSEKATEYYLKRLSGNVPSLPSEKAIE